MMLLNDGDMYLMFALFCSRIDVNLIFGNPHSDGNFNLVLELQNGYELYILQHKILPENIFLSSLFSKY